jgi:hypothetical protein
MRARAVAGLSALLALALASGCVYATKVKVGGREAFRIHCQNQSQCDDKAGEVCAGDYDVLSSSVQPDGFVNNGTGYADSPRELIVACRVGPPAARAPAAKSAAPPAASASPADDGACAAAQTSLKETAAFWLKLNPESKALGDPPSARDFGEVCRALPERVQRCLDARYRDAHDKPCLAVLKRLDPGDKNKIDSLFLE